MSGSLKLRYIGTQKCHQISPQEYVAVSINICPCQNPMQLSMKLRLHASYGAKITKNQTLLVNFASLFAKSLMQVTECHLYKCLLALHWVHRKGTHQSTIPDRSPLPIHAVSISERRLMSPKMSWSLQRRPSSIKKLQMYVPILVWKKY